MVFTHHLHIWDATKTVISEIYPEISGLIMTLPPQPVTNTAAVTAILECRYIFDKFVKLENEC